MLHGLRITADPVSNPSARAVSTLPAHVRPANRRHEGNSPPHAVLFAEESVSCCQHETLDLAFYIILTSVCSTWWHVRRAVRHETKAPSGARSHATRCAHSCRMLPLPGRSPQSVAAGWSAPSRALPLTLGPHRHRGRGRHVLRCRRLIGPHRRLGRGRHVFRATLKPFRSNHALA
jgi:hypothetical protein